MKYLGELARFFSKGGIRANLLWRMAVILILATAVSWFVISNIVLERFSLLELERNQTNIARTRDALDLQIEALETKMGDWAVWDDAYAYMSNGNKEFEVSSLATGSLLTMKIDSFVWITNAGKIRWAKRFEQSSESAIALDSKEQRFFLDLAEKLNLAKGGSHKGIVSVPSRGIFIIGLFPVLKSTGKGDFSGHIVVTRAIDQSFMDRLSSLTKLNLSLKTFQSIDVPSYKDVIEAENESNVVGRMVFEDLFHKPAMEISFRHSRYILEEGKSLLRTAFIAFALIIIITFFSIWVLMNRFMVSRVLNILRELKDLRETKDNRLLSSQTNNDELGTLVENINQFLTTQMEFHRSLEQERAKTLHSSKLASLGEVSAGVAHEVNNPLAIILGTLRIFERSLDQKEKALEKIDIMIKAAERIDKIVKGLKKFSRASTESVKKMESVENIVNDTMIIIGPKSKRFGVSLQLDLQPGLSIYADGVEIEQVLINLVSNGIDAAKDKPEGWVKIKSYREEDEIVLQIIDSGLGLSPKIEEKLFQPFFTTKSVGEGTGLGLSISKGILDNHGAEIRLNKNLPNTCFEIRFPKVAG